MLNEAPAMVPVADPGTVVSEETYFDLSRDQPIKRWELHHGRLWTRPGMTWDHTDIISELGFVLRGQLDPTRYRVHLQGSRLQRSPTQVYIPDLVVVPVAYGKGLRGRGDRLEVLTGPLPLVVEVWSRSTGSYDVEAKLPAYQERGDEEIWLLHPYDRLLTAWRRGADGRYEMAQCRGGPIQPVALPNVSVDLDLLWPEG